MIIRDYESASDIVSQPAHAWISAQIALQWGGNGFLRNEPWYDVSLAAFHHDSGWLQWETQPQLNKETGRPYDFKSVPIEEHIKIWEKSANFIGLSSRYARLLVSRHVVGLSNMHDLIICHSLYAWVT